MRVLQLRITVNAANPKPFIQILLHHRQCAAEHLTLRRKKMRNFSCVRVSRRRTIASEANEPNNEKYKAIWRLTI